MSNSQALQGIQQKLEDFIKSHNFGSKPKELYEPITYLMGLGGKRVRPLLTLLAYRLYRSDFETILPQAMAVEVFHNFTLMHDDIMDQAPLRRGHATVHEKWNANTAILSGDVMLVRAYELLLATDTHKLPDVIRHFSRTAAEVCEGQQLDMNFETIGTVSEGDYIEMIRLKTAVLLGFAFQLGALLAGASKTDGDKLYRFGELVGIGFQLKDDLLDVYADKEKFGKQTGGDIVSNKKTFLLIKALEMAQGSSKSSLMEWLDKKDFDKAAKVEAVTAIYDSLGIRGITESTIRAYFDEAFAQLENVAVTDSGALDVLRGVVENLIGREK